MNYARLILYTLLIDVKTPQYIIPVEQTSFIDTKFAANELFNQEENLIQSLDVVNQFENNTYQWIPGYPLDNSSNSANSLDFFIQNWSSDHDEASLNDTSMTNNDQSIKDNNHATNEIEDCRLCVSNSIDRGPFVRLVSCEQCRYQWARINLLVHKPLQSKHNGAIAQMIHDRQIRLTRAMAHKLTDQYGFGPNVHGYYYHRTVMVKFLHGSVNKECIGILCELRQGKVKVWVPELQAFEWMPIGTQRLQMLTPQQEQNLLNASLDNPAFSISPDNDLLGVDGQLEAEKTLSESTQRRQTTEPILKRAQKQQVKTNSRKRTLSDRSADNLHPAIDQVYLTAGAVAIRTAIGQLNNECGFIPNLHGYAKNQAVRVMDKRGGNKNNYGCRGILVEMQPGYVKVHYTDNPTRNDEWIRIDSQRIQLAGDSSDAILTSKQPLILPIDLDPDSQHEAKRNKRLAETNISCHDEMTTNAPINTTTSNNTKGIKPLENEQKDNVLEKTIISLRIAQLNAPKETGQVLPNIYGYYYMQHITVLHSDRRYYEARIVGIQKNKVRVHYCGWIDRFDESISLGSKRIQAIDNHGQAEKCLEPNYCKRYEEMLLDSSCIKSTDGNPETPNYYQKGGQKNKVIITNDLNSQQHEEEESKFRTTANQYVYIITNFSSKRYRGS